MEYLFIYLLQLSDTIIFLGALSFCLIFFVGFITLIKDDFDDFLQLFKKRQIIIMICLMFISMIFPTKQTLLLVGGTYLGKKAINTVITDKKIEKVNTIIELELDKRIKELKGGN